MIQEIFVDGVIVDRELFTAKFACDIQKCRGVCCYAPDPVTVGPPLTQKEATFIRRHKHEIAKEIPNEDWCGFHKRRGIAISQPITTYKRHTPFRLKLAGFACVYCNSNGCLLKQLHQKDKAMLDEPVSCSLYPVCVGGYPDTPFLYVEHYYDNIACNSGYALGEERGVYLLDFVRSAIIRRFSEPFFNQLKEVQKNVLAGKY